MENQIYFWIGKIAVWVCFGYILYLFTAFILEKLINFLGKKFKSLWIIIEYGYYRESFKKWVKDKQRLFKEDEH